MVKKVFVKFEETRPLILVIVKRLAGDVPNRERFLKNLHLPFILDIVKYDLRIISEDKVFGQNLDRLAAVIIHTPNEPFQYVSFFHGEHFEKKALIHFTAPAYASMKDEHKSLWKLFPQENRLLPKNLPKA